MEAVEHGLGAAGAVLGQAKGMADFEGVAQMRHQQGEQFLVLLLEHGPLGAAPEADDLERAGGDGEDEAGGVLHAAGAGEVAVDLGFDEGFMRDDLFALDDADAGVAQQRLAERIGVSVGGAEALLDLGRHGHSSRGEGAVAEGAVVAQEEADAGAGDVAELREEDLPLRFVEWRGIQSSQELGVGPGRQH